VVTGVPPAALAEWSRAGVVAGPPLQAASVNSPPVAKSAIKPARP
jgi:hypothetical protein